jgi:hypothetical protein
VSALESVGDVLQKMELALTPASPRGEGESFAGVADMNTFGGLNDFFEIKRTGAVTQA